MDISEILKAIHNGQKHFTCAGTDEAALIVFQSLANQVLAAEKRGLVNGVDLRRESYTGRRYISAVSVKELTDAGELMASEV
jgi:hypothetical protein